MLMTCKCLQMSAHPPSEKLSNGLGSAYKRGSLGEFGKKKKKARVCHADTSSAAGKRVKFSRWMFGRFTITQLFQGRIAQPLYEYPASDCTSSSTGPWNSRRFHQQLACRYAHLHASCWHADMQRNPLFTGKYFVASLSFQAGFCPQKTLAALVSVTLTSPCRAGLDSPALGYQVHSAGQIWSAGSTRSAVLTDYSSECGRPRKRIRRFLFII